MLLAIDAGNTNIVFAVFDGDDQRRQWRTETHANRTADEYAVWLGQLMAQEEIVAQDIGAAIIASVVPKALNNLRVLCRSYFSCEPMVIGEEGVKLGLEVRVERPADVGADRLVNAVAAHVAYDGPLIIIDFGTATTLDVVDSFGNYFGGVIAPGINLSLEALHSAAAQLPRIAVEEPPKVVGGSTVAAMQSGIYWGYLGLIEGLVSRITVEIGHNPTVIATGGLASLYANGTNIIQHVDADLTLRGLLNVYQRNEENVA